MRLYLSILKSDCLGILDELAVGEYPYFAKAVHLKDVLSPKAMSCVPPSLFGSPAGVLTANGFYVGNNIVHREGSVLSSMLDFTSVHLFQHYGSNRITSFALPEKGFIQRRLTPVLGCSQVDADRYCLGDIVNTPGTQDTKPLDEAVC